MTKVTKEMINAAHDVTMKSKLMLGHELLEKIYLAMDSQRKPPTPREVKDVLRSTGLLTNSDSWDVAEEIMKLLAAHGIKE